MLIAYVDFGLSQEIVSPKYVISNNISYELAQIAKKSKIIVNLMSL